MTVVLLVAFLVLLPAAVAFLSQISLLQRGATGPAFTVGAPVVYCQEEVANCPTSDAHDIRPSERGEYYYYNILNYLRVTEVQRDGRIIAVARNHERLCFWPNDSSLRKARLTERLFIARAFPIPEREPLQARLVPSAEPPNLSASRRVNLPVRKKVLGWEAATAHSPGLDATWLPLRPNCPVTQ